VPPASVRGSSGAVSVEVRDRQRLLRIAPRWLAGIARRALRAEGVEAAELGIMLVDDRRMAALHERWLGIPGPTDVITFDLAAGPAGTAGLRGDIVVSTETARRQARACGWTPRRELAYYVVHGILHLTGHDDRTTAARRAMRARERAVLQACGLPAPPRARAAGARP
jgi:probable rRNA maturation factor